MTWRSIFWTDCQVILLLFVWGLALLEEHLVTYRLAVLLDCLIAWYPLTLEWGRLSCWQWEKILEKAWIPLTFVICKSDMFWSKLCVLILYRHQEEYRPLLLKSVTPQSSQCFWSSRSWSDQSFRAAWKNKTFNDRGFCIILSLFLLRCLLFPIFHFICPLKVLYCYF